MRIKKLLLVLVACVLSLSIVMPVTSAFAGVNRMEVASVASKDAGWEVNTADGIDWSNIASFKATTAENATVTTSEYFMDYCQNGLKYYSSVTSKFNITSFENNSYFAFSWGAQDYSDKIGTNGTLEVYLKAGSTGKITVGTRVVGDASSVKETADVANLGADFELTAYITADKKVNVFIGAEDDTPELTKEYENPFVGGVFSFGQKGKTTTEVLSLVVNRFDYESPSNPDYTETFDAQDHADGKAGFNANMFATYSKTGPISPSYLSVDTNEETGNSYLRFQNTAHSHVVTKYQYSNFELTFDLFDLANRLIYNENGDPISYPAATFMVYIGCQRSLKNNTGLEPFCATYYGWVAGTNPAANNYETNIGVRQVMTKVGNQHIFRDGEGRVKANGSVVGLNYTGLDGQAKKPVNMLQVTETGVSEPMKVKISLIDGIYKLYVIYAKDYQDETSWDKIGATFKIDLGLTPKGYVGFGFSGSQVEPANGNSYACTAGTCSVDNLTIKNKDSGGATVTNVAFVNNWEEGRADTVYNYNDFYNDDDLLSNKLVPGGTPSGMSTADIIIIIACAVVIVGVAGAVTFLYLKRRVK